MLKSLLASATLALSVLSAAADSPINNPGVVSGDCQMVAGKFTCTGLQGIVANSIFRGYLVGCGTSNDGTSPNTVIDIAACSADDDTYVQFMAQNAFTKNMNSAWASGTGSGCLDTGSSLSASTWYFIYEIYGPGQTADYLCSAQSFGTVTFPTNYTLKRAIGAILTDGSSHILAFAQDGDTWYYTSSSAPYKDVSMSNGSASARTLEALTAPHGIKLRPLFVCNGTGANFWVTSPDQPDFATATTYTNSPGANQGTNNSSNNYASVYSDTAAEVGIRPSGTTNTLTCYTYGFIWDRGRIN